MARKSWLASVLAYLILELGALVGVPMRPDQIEEMTRMMNDAAVVRVVERDDQGDPPE